MKLYKFRVIEIDTGDGNQMYEVGVKAVNEAQGYYIVAQNFPNHQSIDRISRYTQFPDSIAHI